MYITIKNKTMAKFVFIQVGMEFLVKKYLHG